MPDTTTPTPTVGWRTVVHQLGIERIIRELGATARQDYDMAPTDEHIFFEVDCRFYQHLTLFISVHQDDTMQWPTLTIGTRETGWGEPDREQGDQLTYTGGATFALIIVREAIRKWTSAGTL